MFKKYFSWIFVIFFIWFFSYCYSWEYLDFYNSNKNNEIQEINLKQDLDSISLENIKNIENISFNYTPNNEVLETILSKIENAKEKVYIEVYMLTEKRIQNALKNVKNKWIDVKIILEKNPYNSYNINNKAFNYLKNLNIEVVRSNPKNFALNHTKIILIDDESIISSWNLTHSTFKYNRDMFIFTKDQNIVKKLNELFLWDFTWNKNIIFDNNLVISPDTSRKQFENLFNNAKKDIKLYFQYFEDENLKDLLIEKAKKWINISIITDKKNSNIEILKEFENNWIKIKKLEKLTMHSKAILIDEQVLYIWSVNFSTYSIDKNREIWLILKNKDIINEFLKLFYNDFK